MINIPPDAKVIKNSKLTIIRTISTLHDKHVKGKGGLKDQVIEDMNKKRATFAQSEHVVARLLPGGVKMEIDPGKFYELFKSKKITQQQFLGCVSVGKGAAEEILSPIDVAAISVSGATSSQSLLTEFRPGISASIEEVDLSGLILKMLLTQASAAA
jgi:hypothetical protein